MVDKLRENELVSEHNMIICSEKASNCNRRQLFLPVWDEKEGRNSCLRLLFVDFFRAPIYIGALTSEFSHSTSAIYLILMFIHFVAARSLQIRYFEHNLVSLVTTQVILSRSFHFQISVFFRFLFKGANFFLKIHTFFL